MAHKVGRPDNTVRSEGRKLTYESPRVRRVRLDAAGSLLECAKTDTGCSLVGPLLSS